MHTYACIHVCTYIQTCMHAGRQVGRQAARLSLFYVSTCFKAVGRKPIALNFTKGPERKKNGTQEFVWAFDLGGRHCGSAFRISDE